MIYPSDKQPLKFMLQLQKNSFLPSYLTVWPAWHLCMQLGHRSVFYSHVEQEKQCYETLFPLVFKIEHTL